VKARASTILGEFEQAQRELIGKAVILTDGKAGKNQERAELRSRIKELNRRLARLNRTRGKK
jgi:hypothetical protein